MALAYPASESPCELKLTAYVRSVCTVPFYLPLFFTAVRFCCTCVTYCFIENVYDRWPRMHAGPANSFVREARLRR